MNTCVSSVPVSGYVVPASRYTHAVHTRGQPLVRSRPAPVSRSLTYKKVTKPLLERRRRARMSKCLDELKALMVGPMRITEENLNRMEKADILELAVQYLQTLESDSKPNRYQEGFNECAAEACHFLEKTAECDDRVSERLVEHLETCTGPLTIQVPNYRLTFSHADSPAPAPAPATTTSTTTSTVGLLMEASGKRSSVMSSSNIVNRQRYNSTSSNSSNIFNRNYYTSSSPSPSSMHSYGYKMQLSDESPLTGCSYGSKTPTTDDENVWRPW